MTDIENKPLTKKRFEQLLKKAAQPLPQKESAPKEIGTLPVHPPGGYSGKRKSQGKTEGK